MPNLGRKQPQEEIEKRRMTAAKNRGVSLRLEYDHGLKVCNKCDIERHISKFSPATNASKYGSKVAAICKPCRNKRAVRAYNKKKANRKNHTHRPFKNLSKLRQKYIFEQQSDIAPISHNVTSIGSWGNK